MLYRRKDAAGGVPVGAVILTEVSSPFWDMVMLLVKVAIAAIPASIIVFLVYLALWALLWSVFGVGAWTSLHH